MVLLSTTDMDMARTIQQSSRACRRGAAVGDFIVLVMMNHEYQHNVQRATESLCLFVEVVVVNAFG